MNKEELKQEAEEKCVCTDEAMRIMYRIGYIDGAEPREKRIAELEAQIEKMKCCGNCENRCGQEKCADCHNYSKWKFKQAEQFYEEIAD